MNDRPRTDNPPSFPFRLVRCVGLLSAACCLLLPAGCKRSLEATVEGTVTLDGAPLATGDVALNPTAAGAVGYGRIGADGRYTISTGTQAGLTPGDYVATVVATATAASPMKGVMVAPALPRVLTPLRYGDPKQSDLRLTIRPGLNHIDLPLVTVQSIPAP